MIFVMEYWTILVYILTSMVSINYLFRNFNYFKRNGILHVPPVLIFGNMAAFIFRRISFADSIEKVYRYKPNAKYVGFYFINQPVIMLRDPELIKELFIKNFDSFPNRRGFGDFHETLLTNNLFTLRGQKWRDVRTILSPAFTPSKLKFMSTLMSDYFMDFAKALSKMSIDKSDIDMKEIFSKYMSDISAKCSFGIEIDSMSDPTNSFYLCGKEAASSIGSRGIIFFFFQTFPTFCKLFRLKFLSDRITKFFKDIVKTGITTGDAENIQRTDMIQLIKNKCENKKELSIDDIAAQAFAIFFGSIDSNSIAMSFISHQIAVNPHVQAKLQQEIDEALKNSNGEVTYETINRLEYLEAVINEGLRLHSPIFIERICEIPYKLPPALPNEKSIILKKGQLVWVSIYGIHHDEKYYDEPEKFCPERFIDNTTYQNSPYYLPFGSGPRMCIAKRFALMKIKVLLFHLLAQFELKPCAKTTLPVKLSKNSMDLMMDGGFWLNVQRRNGIQFKIGLTTYNSDTTNW